VADTHVVSTLLLSWHVPLLAQTILSTNLECLITYLQLTVTHQTANARTSSNKQTPQQQQAPSQRRFDNPANDDAAVNWTYKHP
jgi:hypothetical protein